MCCLFIAIEDPKTIYLFYDSLTMLGKVNHLLFCYCRFFYADLFSILLKVFICIYMCM